MVIIFWQNVPSPHLLPFMKHLQLMEKEWKFILVVNKTHEINRVNMGWHFEEDIKYLELVINPNIDEVNNILSYKDSINLFSGFKNFPHSSLVLKYLISGRILGGFIAERPDSWGIKGLIRRNLSIFIEKIYNKKTRILLAFGTDAIEWYVKCGFKPSIVYNFSYTPYSDYDNNNLSDIRYDSNTFNITYVGSIISRKGVDILIKSIAKISPEKNIKLHIIGDGKKFAKIKKLAKKFNVFDKTVFYGFKNNVEARVMISNSDLLILPSHFDGWGAVVNEALLEGIPVICTKECGASELLDNSLRGLSIPHNDIDTLSKSITYFVDRGKLSDSTRDSIKEWSIQSISDQAVANYFLKIIRHQFLHEGNRPVAPWL